MPWSWAEASRLDCARGAEPGGRLAGSRPKAKPAIAPTTANAAAASRTSLSPPTNEFARRLPPQVGDGERTGPRPRWFAFQPAFAGPEFGCVPRNSSACLEVRGVELERCLCSRSADRALVCGARPGRAPGELLPPEPAARRHLHDGQAAHSGRSCQSPPMCAADQIFLPVPVRHKPLHHVRVRNREVVADGELQVRADQQVIWYRRALAGANVRTSIFRAPCRGGSARSEDMQNSQIRAPRTGADKARWISACITHLP